MDRVSALGELPALHAVAIRLRDDGVGDRIIAVALAIAPGDVPDFLDIAYAKLARLEALDGTPLFGGDRQGVPGAPSSPDGESSGVAGRRTPSS